MENEAAESPPSKQPAPSAPAAKAARRNRGWILWAVVILLALGLFMSLMMNFGLAMSMMGKGGSMAGLGGKKAVDQFPEFTETRSWGTGGKKVIRMSLNGAIFRGGEPTLFGPGEDKVEALLKQIRAAENDSAVEGIILEINSPGGAVTPSDEIYKALLRFKESGSGNRVVVSRMIDLAASGGYYVAAASDHILAEPTTIVGSIGVIMQSINMKGLADKVGIKDTTIKSGANKDLLNPFQDVDPEEIALLQEMVDSMMARFFDIVQQGRNMDPEKLKEIADGRVFTAEQALTHDLIDEVGYWEDTVAATETLLGGPISVFRYQGRPTFMEMLYGAQAKKQGPSILDLQAPRFLYLWRP